MIAINKSRYLTNININLYRFRILIKERVDYKIITHLYLKSIQTLL